MKKVLLYTGLLFLCCLTSFYFGRASLSNQMQAIQTAATSAAVRIPGNNTLPPQAEEHTPLANTPPLATNNSASEAFFKGLPSELSALSDFSQLALPSIAAAKEAIAKLPPQKITSHLESYLKPEDLSLINDQQQFAQKLAAEYLDENPSQYVDSEYPSTIHFSLTKEFQDTPFGSLQLTKAIKKSKVYAHLKMNPSVVNNSHVFVKWMNLDTGKVMLFDKKRISSGSDQNWVSFSPNEGWKLGAYKVRLYQFNDELTSIAEGHYYLYE